VREHLEIERTVLAFALLQAPFDRLPARDVANGAEQAPRAGSRGGDGGDGEGRLDGLAAGRLELYLPLLDLVAPGGPQPREARAEGPAMPAADERGEGLADQSGRQRAEQVGGGEVDVADVPGKVRGEEAFWRAIEKIPIAFKSRLPQGGGTCDLSTSPEMRGQARSRP